MAYIKKSWNQVKWFTDGAEFNTNHELLIWLWSSTLADQTYNTKFCFAALPMRLLPTKDLRKRANQAVVEVIAWDSNSPAQFGRSRGHVPWASRSITCMALSIFHCGYHILYTHTNIEIVTFSLPKQNSI